jgi:hypothetical protein
LLGAWLRILFLIAVPEAYYGVDSNSYFDSTLGFWTDHKFTFEPKRRGLYTLALIGSPLFPGSVAQSTAYLQHLLGLLAIPAIGWITGHLTRLPAIWVPITTCCAAFHQGPLWFEHEMIADAPLLVAFVIALALAFPVDGLKGRRLLFFLIACFVVVAMKPHGRPLWAGLVLASALLHWPVWKWGRASLGVITACLAVILGTGSSKQGSWLLLSSALPLVSLEGKDFAEYRRLLTPVVTEVRKHPGHYPWVQGQYKKSLSSKDPNGPLGPEWAALVRDKRRYAVATKKLAVEAVLRNPFRFLSFAVTKILICAADAPARTHDFAPKDFWDEQEDRNNERWERKGELELVYGRDREAYDRMVEERRSRADLVPKWITAVTASLAVVRVTNPANASDPWSASLTWTGWLGLAGVAALCWYRRKDAILLLFLPAGIYLLMIYGIGDAVTRYFLPLGWLGVTLACVGADALVTNALPFLRWAKQGFKNWAGRR